MEGNYTIKSVLADIENTLNIDVKESDIDEVAIAVEHASQEVELLREMLGFTLDEIEEQAKENYISSAKRLYKVGLVDKEFYEYALKDAEKIHL